MTIAFPFEPDLDSFVQVRALSGRVRRRHFDGDPCGEVDVDPRRSHSNRMLCGVGLFDVLTFRSSPAM